MFFLCLLLALQDFFHGVFRISSLSRNARPSFYPICKICVAISSSFHRESACVHIPESEFGRLERVGGGRKVSQNELFQLICFLFFFFLYKCDGQDPNGSGFPASMYFSHHSSLARTLIPEHRLQNHLSSGVQYPLKGLCFWALLKDMKENQTT